MAQNRPPPAFQEYAANMMARTEYRVLTLAQRGLLMTLRLECWVNQRMPSDPERLARMLGFGSEEVRAGYRRSCPSLPDEDGYLTCPELDDYRNHLQEISDKKAAGGKRGAAITNGTRKAAETKAGRRSREVSGIPRVSRDSLVQLSSVQPSKTQPLEKGVSVDPWVSGLRGGKQWPLKR